MTKIKELSVYDFPDTKHQQDGYEFTTVIDMSADNMNVLMEKINEIIQTVNQLLPPG